MIVWPTLHKMTTAFYTVFFLCVLVNCARTNPTWARPCIAEGTGTYVHCSMETCSNICDVFKPAMADVLSGALHHTAVYFSNSYNVLPTVQVGEYG